MGKVHYFNTMEKDHGPVVQSIVSLTNSLRGQLSLSVLPLYNQYTDIFVGKMREAFALQKLLAIFQQKYWHISDINV